MTKIIREEIKKQACELMASMALGSRDLEIYVTEDAWKQMWREDNSQYATSGVQSLIGLPDPDPLGISAAGTFNGMEIFVVFKTKGVSVAVLPKELCDFLRLSFGTTNK